MSTKDTAGSFATEVWDKLSRIDVTEHVDTIEATAKRPAVNYLSWSVAWMLLKRNFPGSTYSHAADRIYEDGTQEVEVEVVISDGYNRAGDTSNAQYTMARLSVMDYYYAPISKPTARQINDSRQRCLVKALAFAGLGLNLWSDSSIPVGRLDDPITPEQLEEITELVEVTGTDMDRFLNWCDVENLRDLPYERHESAHRLLLSRKARQEIAAKNKKEKAK
jgi:hypothetical protein